jgi:thiamine-monophosphate kinase
VTDKISTLGEFGLIDAVVARFPQGPNVLVGPGDDAAVIGFADGRAVATTDFMIESTHFRRAWSPPYDVGRKAAARNLSDVAAMGGRASALLVSLAAPSDLDVAWVLALAEGLRDESDLVGASIVGGDMSAAQVIVVAVTALGELDGRSPVTRAGAQPGDVVAVCGRLGWAAAGLAVLSRGFRSPLAVVDAHRRPEPPYDAGPEASMLGAHAMIDVSDGLLADLGHVARASRVDIDLDPSAFEVAQPVRDVGAAIGVDPLSFVLTGGDDNALAACFRPDGALPARWRVVGRVTAPAQPDTASVTVGGAPYEGSAGWTHFR